MTNTVLLALIGLMCEILISTAAVVANPQISPLRKRAVEFTPHIIFILTDDLGAYSPGLKNKDLITPVLDKLASNGIFLEEHYTFRFCAPTRGSLLTGRFPYKLSATRRNYPVDERDGIDLRFEMLPSMLKKAGYISHHVGKWHLGYCDYRLTPVPQGFETTDGYLTSEENHFSQAIQSCPTNAGDINVTDIWIEGKVSSDVKGTYNDLRFSTVATSIITSHAELGHDMAPLFLYLALSNTHKPLQVPNEYLELYSNISYAPQQTFYAMMSFVDKVLGDVVTVLQSTGLWENTVLVWASDNGSPASAGSNWPLRGLKNSNWEGGTRTPAIVTGGRLPAKMKGKALPGMIHMCDWFATILSLAGLPATDERGPSPSDGINMWPWLIGDIGSSPRNVIVYDHNLYRGEPATGAIRVGKFKLLVGEQSSASWYGGASNNYFNNNASVPLPDLSVTACADSPCLFDLDADPTEHEDIASSQPLVVARLLKVWSALSSEFHPPVDAEVIKDGFCAAAEAHGGYLVPYTSL